MDGPGGEGPEPWRCRWRAARLQDLTGHGRLAGRLTADVNLAGLVSPGGALPGGATLVGGTLPGEMDCSEASPSRRLRPESRSQTPVRRGPVYRNSGVQGRRRDGQDHLQRPLAFRDRRGLQGPACADGRRPGRLQDHAQPDRPIFAAGPGEHADPGRRPTRRPLCPRRRPRRSPRIRQPPCPRRRTRRSPRIRQPRCPRRRPRRSLPKPRRRRPRPRRPPRPRRGPRTLPSRRRRPCRRRPGRRLRPRRRS